MLQQIESTVVMEEATETAPLSVIGGKRKVSMGRVLIAEDDAEMRDLLASELRNQDYEVVEAVDGLDLLAKLSRSECQGHPVDLIITDQRMPQLTGLQVLQRMSEEGFQAPVILITAFGDRVTHRNARALGAAMVLDKPFAIGALFEAIHSLPPLRSNL